MANTYEQLRRQWQPDRVRLLLIGESAPDPREASLRFFYAPTLTPHDNLFRAVILALYGRSAGRAGDAKRRWLDALQHDGVYLIDVVPFPVNALTARERAAAVREFADRCSAQAVALRPKAVAVCHGPTFKVLRPALTDVHLPVIHSDPLPFPIGNWRQRFVTGLGDAVDAAGLRFQPPS